MYVWMDDDHSPEFLDEEDAVEEHKLESKGNPFTSEAKTASSGASSGQVQTRRIVNAVPQLAMVDPSELTTRLTDTQYQWATTLLICKYSNTYKDNVQLSITQYNVLCA
jgi:hypothetical protein